MSDDYEQERLSAAFMFSVALQPSVHVLHKFIHDLIFPSFPYQPCGPRWYFVPYCGTSESRGHVSKGKVVCIFKCIFASNDDNGVKCIKYVNASQAYIYVNFGDMNE